MNYRLSNIKYQLSSINYQLSIIKYRLSSIKYQLSIIKYQLSTKKCRISNINQKVDNEGMHPQCHQRNGQWTYKGGCTHNEAQRMDTHKQPDTLKTKQDRASYNYFETFWLLPSSVPVGKFQLSPI